MSGMSDVPSVDLNDGNRIPQHDGDFVSTWKTMEELRADGRARSIGVPYISAVSMWR